MKRKSIILGIGGCIMVILTLTAQQSAHTPGWQDTANTIMVGPLPVEWEFDPLRAKAAKGQVAKAAADEFSRTNTNPAMCGIYPWDYVADWREYTSRFPEDWPKRELGFQAGGAVLWRRLPEDTYAELGYGTNWWVQAGTNYGATNWWAGTNTVPKPQWLGLTNYTWTGTNSYNNSYTNPVYRQMPVTNIIIQDDAPTNLTILSTRQPIITQSNGGHWFIRYKEPKP